MDVDTKCVLCNRQTEDGGHLFFKCKDARKVWEILRLEEHMEVLATSSGGARNEP